MLVGLYFVLVSNSITSEDPNAVLNGLLSLAIGAFFIVMSIAFIVTGAIERLGLTGG